MTRFLVFHKLPNVMTQEEMIAAGRAMSDAQSSQAKWLRGWVSPESDHLVGEWEAEEEQAVRMALEEVEPLPVKAIRLVIAVDPVWFEAPDSVVGTSGRSNS